MFLGLRTVIYYVPDVARAKAWYRGAFGVEPYYDTAYYVGFTVGGYELGLHPNVEGAQIGTKAVAYWGVPEIAAAHAALVEKGALPADPITDVGDGIKVASVKDPWGNAIGIIENPHFKLP